MEFVPENDTVVVHSMDRLARKPNGLPRIVDGLTGHAVRMFDGMERFLDVLSNMA